MVIRVAKRISDVLGWWRNGRRPDQKEALVKHVVKMKKWREHLGRISAVRNESGRGGEPGWGKAKQGRYAYASLNGRRRQVQCHTSPHVAEKMMITGSLIALFGLASHNLESRTPDRRRNSSVAATSRGGGRTAKRTTQNRKEGRKSEVDNLARRLGLHQPPKSKKRPKSSLVSTKVRLQYATKGHAALRGFLDESTVKMLYDECNRVSAIETLSAWQQKVDVQARRGKQNAHAVATKLGSVEECQDMLDSGADELPFLQFFNIWKRDDAPTVRRVCLSPHLAETASILLD
ncbi:hypothetical protein THAOC_30660, partial [Thalassiosira oceanica]